MAKSLVLEAESLERRAYGNKKGEVDREYRRKVDPLMGRAAAFRGLADLLDTRERLYNLVLMTVYNLNRITSVF